MGIFSSIKGAIFGNKEAQAAPAATATPAAAVAAASAVATEAAASAAAAVAAAPTAVSELDVAATLDGMAGADKLNWRSSIVDLMKLLGLDPSLANRKELAGELGDADYSGTAEENIWLHKKTMQELAKNGGRVPAEFLD